LNISICIATYGSDEWEQMALTRALPSAQAQEVEVVVGHDPSGTIAQVRNDLAEKATGEWLCFLDADDELGPGFVEEIQRSNRVTTFYNKGKEVKYVLYTPAISYVHKGRPRPPRFHPIGNLQDDNFLVVGTIVERELFLQVGGFSDYPHGFEDWSLWAKCWKVGVEIVQVPRAVYIAYINPRSAHRTGWRDKKWQVDMHMKVRAELFPELS
jgi:glycosyltransferase involved in cell wall biosynthesis